MTSVPVSSRGPTSGALADDVERALLAAIEHATAAAATSAELLADHLYAGWYTVWSPAQASPEARPAGVPWDGLAEGLRAAHADSARFEDGWTAVRVWRSGRVVARAAGADRVLDPLDYVTPDRPALPPRPGSDVRVVARRDSVTAQAGYWITYGGAWGRSSVPVEQVRLYWNVRADSAPALVYELTSRLGATGIPYALKLPVAASDYRRTDAAVLFLARSDFAVAAPELRGARSSLEAALDAGTPPLTRRLAAGLGLADEPGGGESFGTSRCRLVAQALAPELARGEHEPQALLTAIATRFLAARIAPASPHLNPPGAPDYEW